jgi:hypothetical protein
MSRARLAIAIGLCAACGGDPFILSAGAGAVLGVDPVDAGDALSGHDAAGDTRTVDAAGRETGGQIYDGAAMEAGDIEASRESSSSVDGAGIDASGDSAVYQPAWCCKSQQVLAVSCGEDSGTAMWTCCTSDHLMCDDAGQCMCTIQAYACSSAACAGLACVTFTGAPGAGRRGAVVACP